MNKSIVVLEKPAKPVSEKAPRLRDVLPSDATIHPSRGLFTPSGSFENVFMKSAWTRTCLMAFDAAGTLFVAQSGGLNDEFDYVVSKVDLATGAKTALIVGDDMENICRRTVYHLKSWHVVTTVTNVISLPEIVISDVIVDWDDKDVLM